MLLLTYEGFTQSAVKYEISFENAVHHEAEITFFADELPRSDITVSMSRSSPGRYAIHEFAKNVYDVKAYSGSGEQLSITRPNPYQWKVSGHDGKIKFTYKLFADRGDGTYSQIDETHAHLNMPSAFAFVKALQNRPIEITFNTPANSEWKVATQLNQIKGNTYFAPNLQYFLDSPTEISDHVIQEFSEESNGKEYAIRIAVHHPKADSVGKLLLPDVKAFVREQKAIMGSLPDYEYGTYTFLTCLMPQATSDAMEHRNSTYVVNSHPIEKYGTGGILSSMAHEFWHCWNVERIRPASLEPFDFEKANMSDELWFAEGFTNYYSALTRHRSGILSAEQFLGLMSGSLNYVKNSPGRNFFNPIQMSQQAPFSDAATSIDPTNMGNTFISYYSYGSVVGLALDLSLRGLDTNKNLDDYMKMIWDKFGKSEKPYTIEDLKMSLAEYSDGDFANAFFGNFIYGSQFPDFEKLFSNFGISYAHVGEGIAYLGAQVTDSENGLVISQYTKMGGPAYNAGLESGDIILAINDIKISGLDDFQEIMKGLSPDDEISVSHTRNEIKKQAVVKVGENPAYLPKKSEDMGIKVNDADLARRNAWLNPR